MVGVGDGVDVDRVVVLRGSVGKVNDGSRTCRRGRGVEGGEDPGVRPSETCGDAEDGEGSRQEGGERGGDGSGRDIEGGGIVGGEGTKESSGGELREADSKCLSVLGDGVFNGGATPALPQHDPQGVLSRVVILPLQGSPLQGIPGSAHFRS